MSTYYQLANLTRRERVSFAHLPMKQREIAGDPAVAAIVSWYLFTRMGDHIVFLPDGTDDWPSIDTWPDATDEIVDDLISNGILEDHGKSWQDEEEPELYMRDLRNVWMSRSGRLPG